MTKLTDDHLTALRIAQIGKCNCLTKTPDPKFHSAKCLYRLITEVIQVLECSALENIAAASSCIDAVPSSEHDEPKAASPTDQAIADAYERGREEKSRSLSEFERVVLEYIAFNDGFINTRIRARKMLDRPSERERKEVTLLPQGFQAKRVGGHGWVISSPSGTQWVVYEGTPIGELMNALINSTPTLSEKNEPTIDRERWRKVLRFAKGIIDRLDTTEVIKSSVSGLAYDAAERAVFIRNLANEALSDTKQTPVIDDKLLK